MSNKTRSSPFEQSNYCCPVARLRMWREMEWWWIWIIGKKVVEKNLISRGWRNEEEGEYNVWYIQCWILRCPTRPAQFRLNDPTIAAEGQMTQLFVASDQQQAGQTTAKAGDCWMIRSLQGEVIRRQGEIKDRGGVVGGERGFLLLIQVGSRSEMMNHLKVPWYVNISIEVDLWEGSMCLKRIYYRRFYVFTKDLFGAQLRKAQEWPRYSLSIVI